MVDIEFHFGRPRLSRHDREAFEALRKVLEHKARRGVSGAEWADYRSLILSPSQPPEAPARLPESGTTARCRRVLADLERLFGTLDGMEIAEIGAGCGSQCKLIADAHAFSSYTIFDLAPMTALVFRYLERTGCAVLGRVSGTQLPPAHADVANAAIYDLVISNWTLSEYDRDEQDHYIRHVLRRARRGYITYNSLSHALGRGSYDCDGFVEALGFPVQCLGGGSGAEGERCGVYWDTQPLLPAGG